MPETSLELMHEVLKEIRTGQERLTQTLTDNGHQFAALRKQIHGVEGQIHTLHGETLRYDERFDQIERRLDRIEKRLGLTDA